jgi:hypothetical protein
MFPRHLRLTKPIATRQTYWMTQARRQLVDPNHAGTFHCVNRCVRRSWLCGIDAYTKDSFEHRKLWVEQRILELGGIFACGIYSWAVMSNHLHLLVHMNPDASNAWTAEDVAARWGENGRFGGIAAREFERRMAMPSAGQTLSSAYRRAVRAESSCDCR